VPNGGANVPARAATPDLTSSGNSNNSRNTSNKDSEYTAALFMKHFEQEQQERLAEFRRQQIEQIAQSEAAKYAAFKIEIDPTQDFRAKRPIDDNTTAHDVDSKATDVVTEPPKLNAKQRKQVWRRQQRIETEARDTDAALEAMYAEIAHMQADSLAREQQRKAAEAARATEVWLLSKSESERAAYKSRCNAATAATAAGGVSGSAHTASTATS
jgi:hypothetical protein